MFFTSKFVKALAAILKFLCRMIFTEKGTFSWKSTVCSFLSAAVVATGIWALKNFYRHEVSLYIDGIPRLLAYMGCGACLVLALCLLIDVSWAMKSVFWWFLNRLLTAKKKEATSPAEIKHLSR